MLSFFPLDVLDGIWDLIESVSEGFLTYTSVSFDAMNFLKYCFVLNSLHHYSSKTRQLNMLLIIYLILYSFTDCFKATLLIRFLIISFSYYR